mmetsp:Transcript_27346/g.50166  ORF Transcript_27346/g.50166 Transcript_27346/m.50166 type:complete len:338 (+) Transcript_27346:2924-3937(+)
MPLHLGGIGGGAPINVDRMGCLKGPPGVIGQNGDAASNRQNVNDTAHVSRRSGIIAVHDPAASWVGADRGVQQARHLDINAVGLCSGGFRHDINTFHRLSNQPPLVWIAQRDVLDRVQSGGQRCQFFVAERAAIGHFHAALRCPERPHIDARALRRRRFERFAGHGTCHPQLFIAVRNRGRPTGDLHAHEFHHDIHHAARRISPKTVIRGAKWGRVSREGGVVVGGAWRAGIDAHLLQIHVQLFGDQRGLHGIGPLPAVSPGCDQGDAARINFNVRCQGRSVIGQPIQQRIFSGPLVGIVPKGDAAQDGGGADQKTAAGNGSDAAHLTPPAVGLRRF